MQGLTWPTWTWSTDSDVVSSSSDPPHAPAGAIRRYASFADGKRSIGRSRDRLHPGAFSPLFAARGIRFKSRQALKTTQPSLRGRLNLSENGPTWT